MCNTETDWSKSVQELERADWGDPTAVDTSMIGRVLVLRRKPLRQLSNAEVRLAVSQKVGFPFILELAIDRIYANPMIEGEHYPGDILAALLRVEDADWEGRDALRSRLVELFTRAMIRADEDAEYFKSMSGLPSSGFRPN